MTMVARAWLAASTIGLATGCAQILGIDDYRTGPPPVAPPPKPAITFANADCGTCVQTKCEAPLGSCALEPSCKAEASCFYVCPKTGRNSCQYQCLADSWKTTTPTEAKNLQACMISQCSDQCLTCGTPFVGHGTSCGDCVEAANSGNVDLCTLTNACLGGEGCRSYESCLAAHCDQLGRVDPRCRLVCDHEVPNVFRLQAMFTQFGSVCGKECAVGAQWDCRLSRWPAAAGTAHVTLDFTGQFVFPSAASLCDNPVGRPVTCDPPKTAPDGGSSITFDFEQSPFGHVFEILSPDPAWLSAYLVVNYPLYGNVSVSSPNLVGKDYNVARINQSETQRGNPPIDITNRGLVQLIAADCWGSRMDPESVTITADTGTHVPVWIFGATFIRDVEPPTTNVVVQANGGDTMKASVPVRAGYVTNVYFDPLFGD